MNTKPVDVLATLGALAKSFASAPGFNVLVDDVTECHAAIAELIAAIDEWSASREAQLAVVGTDAYPEARERHEKAAQRFDAALARVKGE